MASIINNILYPEHIALTSKTASEWASSDPVLLKGELGIESDTLKVKVGNGIDAWSDIAYLDANIQTAITNIYVRLDGLESLAEALMYLFNSIIHNIEEGELHGY